MFKSEKGRWEPTKVFPCDCGGEGVTVTLFVDDEFNEDPAGPYFDMSMWQNRKQWETHKMPWKLRLRAVWQSLLGKTPWRSQVSFSADVGRNMANHILYQLNLAKESRKPKPDPEQPAPFFLKDENVPS